MSQRLSIALSRRAGLSDVTPGTNKKESEEAVDGNPTTANSVKKEKSSGKKGRHLSFPQEVESGATGIQSQLGLAPITTTTCAVAVPFI